MARIAIYAAGGAPYNHAAILADSGHEVEFVFPVDILAGALDSFDAFVMPGGGYSSMKGQLDPLGADGCRTIREYVEEGGMYIGSCAGSYDAATVPDAFLAICPIQSELRLVDARVWNDGSSTLGIIQSPGIGELISANAAPDHPVMAGMPDEFRITHYNGPLFSGGTPLATLIGRTSNFTPAEEFLGDADGALLVDEGVSVKVSNIVADERGAGRVVLFGSHPEFGATLALDDIAPAAAMLTNAVAWQLAADTRKKPAAAQLATDASIAPETVQQDLAGLPSLVASIEVKCAALSSVPSSVAWLGEDQAMSMFGRSGREIWENSLEHIPVFAREAAAGAAKLPDGILSFRPPTEWMVDGGFWGVAPLLEQVDELLEAAMAASGSSFPATDGYDHMRDSPYHLVAGSYLSAIGRAVGAALLVRAFGTGS